MGRCALAFLEGVEGGERRPLAHRTLVGRAAAAGVVLDDRRASHEHAVVYWRDGGWWVRDLGSRNGTFVAGARVEVGARAALEPGAVVGFGAAGGWRLGAGGPPRAMAWPVGGGAVRLAEDGLLALPDAEAPAVMVYAGEGGWRVESEAADAPLAGAVEVEAGGVAWRVWAPAEASERPRTTVEARGRAVGIADVGLCFAVSRDEEHVEVTVEHAGGAVVLEPRAHHYTLLVLARLRLADAGAGAEAGWVDSEVFSAMLGAAPQKTNLEVFRARRQLAEHGIEDAGRLVERRPQARKLRIGVARLRVVPLERGSAGAVGEAHGREADDPADGEERPGGVAHASVSQGRGMTAYAARDQGTD